jgi:long-chain fatty acid transport protein
MTLFHKHGGLLGTVAVTALLAGTASAIAGGFAVREQSAESQGASFAGNAAGTSLGVMFWNPAGAANKIGPGLYTESNYSLIIPRADVNVDSITANSPAAARLLPAFGPTANSTDIGMLALVPASYASYQLSPNSFVGLGLNSAFGLATKPDDTNYDGSILARRSSLFTLGANPNFAYVISPGVTVGVGAQISYGKGTFKFATGLPTQPSSTFSGDDFAFGATAGIMLTPANGTRIGLGWRSAVTYELEGDFNRPPVPALGLGAQNYKGTVDVKLPDIVTLSINQAIAPNMRLLGTVEWSNWSRFSELRVKDKGGVNPDLVIPANWVDGWFFSVGGEYDYSKRLTLRTGVGYEWSPIDDAKNRLISVPDTNRVWLSFGGSYRLTEATTVDLAYTHIFFEDAPFDRNNTNNSLTLKGTVDSSTDIVSLGLKTRW